VPEIGAGTCGAAGDGASSANIAVRPLVPGGKFVTTLTIRDIDEELRAELRVRAARHGRSMEAEVRSILRTVLTKPLSGERLGTRVHLRFASIGTVDLDWPERNEPPRVPTLPA